MFNVNSQVEYIGMQMKQMKIQFENLIFQINNFGINNCGINIQNMGIQMLNAGAKMVNIGIQLPTNGGLIGSNIKQQIQEVLTNIQNIVLQIDNKIQMEMMNNMMMNQMQMINMNIVNNINNKESINKDYNYNIKKYNVTFDSPFGKIVFVIDKETTIKEVIEIYLKRVGKSKDKLLFIYNADKINIDDNKKIKDFFTFISNPRIYVEDFKI